MTARVSACGTAILTIAIALTCGLAPAAASKNFLADESKQLSSAQGRRAFQQDIVNALGCGGQASQEQMSSIKQALTPMWNTLPKTGGKIDRRSLRYLAHRYFMQASSLMIRGFEPSRLVNESHWGVADILSQVVPAYVESVLESRHAKQHGFSLDDSVSMIVMLEQLIFDTESSLLEKVYSDQGKPTQLALSHKGLMNVLESYMVEWMVEGDAEDIAMLLNNRTLIAEVVPHFENLMQFVEGRIKTLQYDHLHKARKGQSQNTWANKYSFEDAHEIVGGITRSFQSYWQSECDTMKNALVRMDEHNTGRVPLSKFYNTAISTDWRFGESESYLRELGALDESSARTGPQVIIPNYILATSNCIVSTPHYLVCCTNECEGLLGEIEVGIGASTAEPVEILQIVGNMTSQTSIDDDDSPSLAGPLTIQLEQVANAHGGKVPLHGRLFAQWLHYVFPRECPYPNKRGMVSAVTPSQYGEDYIATDADMKKHASSEAATGIPTHIDREELQWMSQWSSEEELSVDYSSDLGTAWQQRLLIGVVGLVLVGMGVWAGVIRFGKKTKSQSSHWV